MYILTLLLTAHFCFLLFLQGLWGREKKTPTKQNKTQPKTNQTSKNPKPLVMKYGVIVAVAALLLDCRKDWLD